MFSRSKGLNTLYHIKWRKVKYGTGSIGSPGEDTRLRFWPQLSSRRHSTRSRPRLTVWSCWTKQRSGLQVLPHCVQTQCFPGTKEKTPKGALSFVPGRGLEPPPPKGPAPKAGVYTNFTTRAMKLWYQKIRVSTVWLSSKASNAKAILERDYAFARESDTRYYLRLVVTSH